MKKAKIMWIESTSGTAKKPTKPKPNVKSPLKKEIGSKKQLVSPFKKIYQTSEAQKLKIKHKRAGGIDSEAKKGMKDQKYRSGHRSTQIQRSATKETSVAGGNEEVVISNSLMSLVLTHNL